MEHAYEHNLSLSRFVSILHPICLCIQDKLFHIFKNTVESIHIEYILPFAHHLIYIISSGCHQVCQNQIHFFITEFYTQCLKLGSDSNREIASAYNIFPYIHDEGATKFHNGECAYQCKVEIHFCLNFYKIANNRAIRLFIIL